jgi:hypothetical protein
MKYVFCLGGQDEEMKEIKKVALAQGHTVHDKNLGWGAKASSYAAELIDIDTNNNRIPPADPEQMNHTHLEIKRNKLELFVPVLVELELDQELPDSTVVIDHHGKEAGRPPALQQVLSLIGVESSRKQDMTGAMDAGYVFGLISMGFHKNEIADLLGEDRDMSIRDILVKSADSSCPDEPGEAERDIAAADILNSGLIIIRRDRNTCAPVTARMYGKQKEQNIFVLSDWTDEETGEHKQEANYYGTGEAVRAIAAEFPQGWTGGAGLMPHTSDAKEFWGKYGGKAPDSAFFGMTGDYRQLEEFVRSL